MRTLKFYRDKESKVKEFINHLAFELYLKIDSKEWNKQTSNKCRVYDSYGMIDTLGFNSTDGRFTFHYSDEMVFMFGFKIWNLRIEFID